LNERKILDSGCLVVSSLAFTKGKTIGKKTIKQNGRKNDHMSVSFIPQIYYLQPMMIYGFFYLGHRIVILLIEGGQNLEKISYQFELTRRNRNMALVLFSLWLYLMAISY
jgi:hypothetical protein